MRYVGLTTMHHDGFMLYDSELSDFNTVRTACGRDLVAETVAAARRRGLRVHLYHSLNHWTSRPDAVAALESKADHDAFIEHVFARIKELVVKYSPDVLWYDGWWPFDATGWRAEAMNAMVEALQPGILVNGRNALPGDFGTPEGHMAAPKLWRPWEACITLNDNWCYVKGDENWKSPWQVVAMLLQAAKGNGNLLLDIGPEPDGAIPAKVKEILLRVGDWLRCNGDAVFDTEVFDMGLMERGSHRSDWSHVVDYTASGDNLYLTVKYSAPSPLVISGLRTVPTAVSRLADGSPLEFDYSPEEGRLVIKGLVADPAAFRPVVKVTCVAPPEIRRCGGMRTPSVSHPPYDPCPSDLLA
jgi:alpha-L-fucosidase